MGQQKVERRFEAADLRGFVRHIIRDLTALEAMLRGDRIESDRDRIGAEQELVLVDDAMRPACVAREVLDELGEPGAFSPELARFNVEVNTPPLDFTGDCLSRLEKGLLAGVARVRDVAARHGADVVMTGILPTLTPADLDLTNMMDLPRYRALNDALIRSRGGDYTYRIKGTDELVIQHASVMVETCNTSFQVHCQVRPADFARVYNIAQLVAAPVLAVATGSPLLFGKRLWRETRIALFQQSMDTRSNSSHDRDSSPRVSFGDGWVRDSVVEIFREDVARHRVLLGAHFEEDAVDVVENGGTPGLDALRLHNGTVYRWNRPCYGVAASKAHLRIENRMLPAGPSVVDEVANAAFWLGLLMGGLEAFGDVPARMDFDEAHANFTAAAYRGLGAHFVWLGGEPISAGELIVERLLPIAQKGLARMNVDPADVERYLGIIERRTLTGLSGSQWLLSSLAAMKDQGSRTERMAALTAALIARQKDNHPVHTWELADLSEAGGWKRHFRRVGQFMSTDLFTVNRNEAIDLVACMMDWRRIRHVPVEDDDHRLVGLVSHRTLLRLLTRGRLNDGGDDRPVHEIMHTDLITVEPETPTTEAVELMRRHKIACLPVVKAGRLVGIVTETDFLRIAAALFENELKSSC